MKLGIKAWWKDADIMAKLGTKLMEVHIEPEDLFQHYKEMVDTFQSIFNDYEIELVVHNQEYWIEGGNYQLVDLASPNELQRNYAKKIVKKTLKFASEIGASYVIVHPGGISPEVTDKDKLLSLLKNSLKEIGNRRLIVENMPWFYIMRDGSIWRSNICIWAADFFEFSDLVGGVTLDVCHAYLSTEIGGNEYIVDMKKTVKNLIRHVHASDAKPPHHEGVQIGEGKVDFSLLRDFKVGIIPEILGGHENDGEGFKIAIERLQSYH